MTASLPPPNEEESTQPYDRFAIIFYAYCGVSMGKIAHLCKVSTVAVLKWVWVAVLEAKPINSVPDSNIVIIDKVWHFVNGKKQWIWRAWVLHRPLGWELGPRGDASAKTLISRVDTGTCSFVTDENTDFSRLSWSYIWGWPNFAHSLYFFWIHFRGLDSWRTWAYTSFSLQVCSVDNIIHSLFYKVTLLRESGSSPGSPNESNISGSYWLTKEN